MTHNPTLHQVFGFLSQLNGVSWWNMIDRLQGYKMRKALCFEYNLNP